MQIKILFILTVLISFGINRNRGEVIRGVDTVRINVAPIIGKWYLLASTKILDLNICATCIVKPLAGDNFTIHVTTAPKIITANANEFILSATIKSDSNIIFTTRSNGQPGPLIIMFSLGYESHVGLYVADSMTTLTTGRRGAVYIIGRDKTLPEGILEDAKDTGFYEEGVNPFDGLFGTNAIPCNI